MTTVTAQWRTVQFFISTTGVCEVETDGSGGYRCTCGKRECKHVRFCRKVADENGGPYPVVLNHKATDSEIERARKNPRRFRELVLRYARPEVM